MDPLFTHERFGFAFKVWPNRIEVTSGTTIKKQEVLPLRNIASAAVEGLVPKLVIRTNDGKKHEFQLGTENKRALEIILNAL